MSFLNGDQLVELAALSKAADQKVRLDLSVGLIRDENDYTSNFTRALKDLIQNRAETGLSAQSFLLQTGEERKIGADAAIILSNESESKVAVFEAKWPRFRTEGYVWDHKQRGTGKSHFSDQLDRQRKWSPQLAVFEMFYCEYPFHEQPKFLLPTGSSCVWHDDAQAFRMARADPDALWSQYEAEQLIRKNQIQLPEVMLQFGICRKGSPINMIDPLSIAEEFKLPPIVLALRARAATDKQQRMRAR